MQLLPGTSLLFGLGLLVMAASQPASWIPTNNCTGNGFTSGGEIMCIGDCAPTPPFCMPQQVNDSQGKPLYKYCGCGPLTEPACCHAVEHNWNGLHLPDVAGDCPSCPLTGSCILDSQQKAACK